MYYHSNIYSNYYVLAFIYIYINKKKGLYTVLYNVVPQFDS